MNRLHPRLKISEEVLPHYTLSYRGAGVGWKGSAEPQPIHKIVHLLLGRELPHEEPNPLLTYQEKWCLFKAICVAKDPSILKTAREEMGCVLESCEELLPSVQHDEQLDIALSTFVAHVISLLPYIYPEEGEEFLIPQKVEGKWAMYSYRVGKRLELTPPLFSAPLVAFPFEPQNEGPSLLSFLGTTYPTGDGFIASLLSDCTPGTSVGHVAYLTGRKAIVAWLRDQPKPPRLFGASLGGAIALHVLRHHKDLIGEVDLFNPPGLYPWNWSERFDEGPEIRIHYQENDLVASMGRFPTGKKVRLHHILGKQRENLFAAHARVFTGGEEVVLFEVKGEGIEQENRRWGRTALTAFHLLFGGLVVFPTLFLLYLIYKVIAVTLSILSFPFRSLPPAPREQAPENTPPKIGGEAL